MTQDCERSRCLYTRSRFLCWTVRSMCSISSRKRLFTAICSFFINWVRTWLHFHVLAIAAKLIASRVIRRGRHQADKSIALHAQSSFHLREVVICSGSSSTSSGNSTMSNFYVIRQFTKKTQKRLQGFESMLLSFLLPSISSNGTLYSFRWSSTLAAMGVETKGYKSCDGYSPSLNHLV